MKQRSGVVRIAVIAWAVALVILIDGPAFAATWMIQSTPEPNGATYSELNAVSCSSASACTAVGRSNKGSNGSDRSLVERWNGSKWKIQSSPNPKRTAGAVLYGVACAAAHSCMAVGTDDRKNGSQLTLAERWNGSKWAIVPTPNPNQKISALNAVTCVSPTSCVAVGGAGPFTTNPIMTLVETWNGSTWAIQPSPNPSGVQAVTFTGVSCSSASACTAVGYVVDDSRNESLLVERWNGTKWKIQTAADPGGNLRGFGAVSCPSDEVCTAVGLYNSGTDVLSLAERWENGQWSIQPTPNPQGTNQTFLDAVSCPSLTSCTATGASQGLGGEFAAAERWNGSSWSLEQPAQPASSTRYSLDGVACSAAKSCEAAGFYEDASGNGFTLAEASA